MSSRFSEYLRGSTEATTPGRASAWLFVSALSKVTVARSGLNRHWERARHSISRCRTRRNDGRWFTERCMKNQGQGVAPKALALEGEALRDFISMAVHDL